MSKKLVDRIFKNYIKKGSLTLHLPNKEILSYGTQENGYPTVGLQVENEKMFSEIINKGNLGLGESFMKKYYCMKEGSLYDFLDILLVNEIDRNIKTNPSLLFSLLLRRMSDSLKGKSHNIRRHYDIGFDVFNFMLGENLTYSCGYLVKEGDSINDLQYQKYQRIINKIQLKDGEHILDIGCGYGSFLIYAAEHYKISGIGVTNSRQHADYANKRIEEKGLAGSIQILCEDYKKVPGNFDKIVSIGMLEHVPRKEYKTYFRLVSRLLKPTGSALIHAVGCNTYKNDHDPFIQKYIFPNSNQPKLSEIAHHVEQQDMGIIDVENMIRHYRPTAKHWLTNFNKYKNKLKDLYTEEFHRMWEYYLSCCISAARYSDSSVYQVLINKSQLKDIGYERI